MAGKGGTNRTKNLGAYWDSPLWGNDPNACTCRLHKVLDTNMRQKRVRITDSKCPQHGYGKEKQDG